MTASLTRRAALSGLAAVAAPSVALAAQALSTAAVAPAPAPGYVGPGVYIREGGNPLMVGEPAQGWGWPVVDGEFVPYLSLRPDGSTDRALLALCMFVERDCIRVAKLDPVDAEDIAETVRPRRKSPDPVFALIDRHRAAEEDFDRACLRTDRVAAEKQGRVITAADDLEYDRAAWACDEALEALYDTPPVTLAGMRAAIAYLVAMAQKCAPDDMASRYLETLLASPALAV